MGVEIAFGVNFSNGVNPSDGVKFLRNWSKIGRQLGTIPESPPTHAITVQPVGTRRGASKKYRKEPIIKTSPKVEPLGADVFLRQEKSRC